MKIVDFDVADVTRSEMQRKLDFPQKYVFLELGNKIYELEISDVSSAAFYLTIKDEVKMEEVMMNLKQ